jgi:copper transport protein
VLAVIAVCGLWPSAAWAHAELLRTDPSPGQLLTEAPAAITLTFSEPVQAPSGSIRVLDSERREIAAASIRTSGATVVAMLPRLDNDGYVVTWRVVSADSHPIGGAFTFGVGEGALLPNASQFAAESAASRTVGVALGAARAVQFASLMVLVGLIVIARLSWADAFVDPLARRVVFVAGAAAVVSAFAGIGLQGANQRGGAIGDAFQSSAWNEVLDTRFGDLWLLRAGLALVLVAFVAFARRGGLRYLTSPFVNGLGAAAIIGIGFTVVNTGHAATGRWRQLSTVADAVHLGAAALWVGGLVAIVLRSRRERLRDEPARSFVRWFSQVALVTVILLTITGVLQGLRQSGTSVGDFVSSAYGRILLAKVVVVLAVVAVARRSRNIVRDAGGLAGRALVRAVRFELVLIAIVVAITAGLVDATPARVEASSGGPILMQETIGNHNVEISVDPARAGPTDLHLTLFEVGTFSTVQARVDEVRAELTEPNEGIGPLTVDLLRGGPAHFISNGLVIPVKGKWDLTITVRSGDFDASQRTISFNVR